MPDPAGTIRITCQGAATAPWDSLTPFQGSLKHLQPEQFQKLRAQILATGFSAPLIAWKHEGKLHLMDGHQRLRVIRHLVEQEGYECPRLPVDWVQAVSIQEAYRKCLSLASQYGRVTEEGLHDFMTMAELGAGDMDGFNFQEVNSEEFRSEYFEDVPQGDPAAGGDQGRLDQKDKKPETLKITCPKCGHEYEA